MRFFFIKLKFSPFEISLSEDEKIKLNFKKEKTQYSPCDKQQQDRRC